MVGPVVAEENSPVFASEKLRAAGGSGIILGAGGRMGSLIKGYHWGRV